jgi:ketosteroid isomerase-like protein
METPIRSLRHDQEKRFNHRIDLLNAGLAFCILFSSFFFVRCHPSQNGSGEIEKITLSIHNCIGWAKNKDLKVLYSVIANDSNYVEVDPNPGLIVGIDQFRENEAFWMSPNFKAIRHEIRDLKISVSRSGDVAWFYCMLDDINEWKGRPANWENTRWTGVLEKRNGQWVMVQQHFSFAK